MDKIDTRCKRKDAKRAMTGFNVTHTFDFIEW